MSDISGPESKIISLIYTRSSARSGRTELLAQQVQTGISDWARTDIRHGTIHALSSVRFKSRLQVCSMKCVLWIAACLNFVCICSVHTSLRIHFAFMIVKHWKMQQSSGTLHEISIFDRSRPNENWGLRVYETCRQRNATHLPVWWRIVVMKPLWQRGRLMMNDLFRQGHFTDWNHLHDWVMINGHPLCKRSIIVRVPLDGKLSWRWHLCNSTGNLKSISAFRRHTVSWVIW